MEKFIDNTLLRLRRQYSKDELVAALNKKLKDVEMELGMVKSERDEYQYKLQKINLWDKETKSRAAQLQHFQKLSSEIQALRKKNKKLKKDNEELLCKLVSKNIPHGITR